MIRRVPYSWKRGCFTIILGIIPCEVKNIIFCMEGSTPGEIEPMPGGIETNLRNERWGREDQVSHKCGSHDQVMVGGSRGQDYRGGVSGPVQGS